MDPVSSLKYAYSEFWEHWNDSIWIRSRLTQRLVRPIHRHYPGYGDAVQVMGEDWDTLIVLDACRAELFESVADLDRFDSYERRTSAGSMTREWTEQNFADGTFGDTVYVSSNPYTSLLAGDAFHHLREVWREGFDPDHRTVLPDTVLEAAMDAHAEYPDKRLVIHFMQPHYPFLDHPDLNYQSWDPEEILEGGSGSERPHDPWQALEMGLVDRETIWRAYADNLERGLAATETLISRLDGRTVLTSDHGNLLGERAWPVPLRLFGHPEGIRHPALVTVPWAILGSDERRSVTDDGVNATSNPDHGIIERRLQDLGYV